ncbi:MAG TPA: hypothetical protein VK212_05220 [Lentimicrobium sp.]|nr:hypothetical protein [Lentimicrobium sp.]
MDSIGTISGLISNYFVNSQNLITILLNPVDGKLMSITVDDGEDVQQFNYEEPASGVNFGTHSLEWGLFA